MKNIRWQHWTAYLRIQLACTCEEFRMDSRNTYRAERSNYIMTVSCHLSLYAVSPCCKRRGSSPWARTREHLEYTHAERIRASTEPHSQNTCGNLKQSPDCLSVRYKKKLRHTSHVCIVRHQFSACIFFLDKNICILGIMVFRLWERTCLSSTCYRPSTESNASLDQSFSPSRHPEIICSCTRTPKAPVVPLLLFFYARCQNQPSNVDSLTPFFSSVVCVWPSNYIVEHHANRKYASSRRKFFSPITRSVIKNFSAIKASCIVIGWWGNPLTNHVAIWA